MRNVFPGLIIVLFCGVVMPYPVGAQAVHDPKTVLAYQGDQVLGQAEIDVAFHQIPEEHRLAFIRDRKKVSFMISGLLLNKILVAEDRKTGLDQDPVIRARVNLAMEKELALAWKERVLLDAPNADLEAIAHETYLANPGDFMTEETVDVSHILISSDEREFSGALELADSLRAQLNEDPGRFDSLIMEYSEDPGKDSNRGRFPNVRRGDMVKPFERTAFALESPGDISQPVRTRYGYHIIRLNERSGQEQLEFDQVKEELVKQAGKKHKLLFRDTYMTRLTQDPVEIPEGALEMMVKRYFGENLELAPGSR